MWVNQESMKIIEKQYKDKIKILEKETKDIELENKIWERNQSEIKMERMEKKWNLNIQETKQAEKEQVLKVKLLQEESLRLKHEIKMLHQKLKDQNEKNIIKVGGETNKYGSKWAFRRPTTK